MKPGHVNAFARHFLNGLPTSFKHTIIVCEKLAPGEVVIKVSPDDHKLVKTLLDEEDPVGSLSRKAKMTEFLKGATAVGVVPANGELLINMGGFIKSLVDHGSSKTMETAINKMKFDTCCNFKNEQVDKLKEIKKLIEDMELGLGKLVKGDTKPTNPPGKSGDSDGSGSDEDSNGNGVEGKSWWSKVGEAVGSWLGW